MYMYMCTCTHPVTLQVYIHVDRFLADRQYRQAVTPKVTSKSVGHSQSGRQAGRRQAILTQGKKDTIGVTMTSCTAVAIHFWWGGETTPTQHAASLSLAPQHS